MIVAQRRVRVELGVDARDALLVLALNLRRTGLRVEVEHGARRQHLALRRADEHVVDRLGPLAVLFAQARTMIGNSLPCSRKVAACVPLMFVRIVFATPDTDSPSSAAFGRSTRIASSGRPSSRPSCGLAMPGTSRIVAEHVVRDALGLFEIVAPDFDRETAVAAAAQQAAHLLVAAGRARRDLYARQTDEHAPQVGRDLIARPRALGCRRELQRDLRARSAATAAARAAEAAAARVAHDGDALPARWSARALRSAARSLRRARCACRGQSAPRPAPRPRRSAASARSGSSAAAGRPPP